MDDILPVSYVLFSKKKLRKFIQFYKSNRDLNYEDILKFLKKSIRGSCYLDYMRLWDYIKEIQSLRKEEFDNVSIIPLDSPKYPQNLRSIDSPPLLLLAKGDINRLLNAKIKVGICGPREISGKESKNIEKVIDLILDMLKKRCMTNKICVISGLAKGVDTIAHRVSLGKKCSTVAILPWLSPITPKENKSLSSEILSSGGALISEFPVSPPDFLKLNPKSFFVRRNRIIAALSDVLFSISSPGKGSIHTIKYAIRYGKPVINIRFEEGLTLMGEYLKRKSNIKRTINDFLNLKVLKNKNRL